MTAYELKTQRYEALNARMEGVASALGWTAGSLEDPRSFASRTLRHADGRVVAMSIDDTGKRFEFTGLFPRDASGHYHGPSQYRDEDKGTFKITVSFDKTDAHVAKDIERRLLPDYSRVYALKAAAVAGADGYNETGRALAKRLVAALAVKPPTNLDDPRAEMWTLRTLDSTSVWSITVNGSGVRFEVRDEKDEGKVLAALRALGVGR